MKARAAKEKNRTGSSKPKQAERDAELAQERAFKAQVRAIQKHTDIAQQPQPPLKYLLALGNVESYLLNKDISARVRSATELVSHFEETEEEKRMREADQLLRDGLLDEKQAERMIGSDYEICSESAEEDGEIIGLEKEASAPVPASNGATPAEPTPSATPTSTTPTVSTAATLGDKQPSQSPLTTSPQYLDDIEPAKQRVKRIRRVGTARRIQKQKDRIDGVLAKHAQSEPAKENLEKELQDYLRAHPDVTFDDSEGDTILAAPPPTDGTLDVERMMRKHAIKTKRKQRMAKQAADRHEPLPSATSDSGDILESSEEEERKRMDDLFSNNMKWINAQKEKVSKLANLYQTTQEEAARISFTPDKIREFMYVQHQKDEIIAQMEETLKQTVERLRDAEKKNWVMQKTIEARNRVLMRLRGGPGATALDAMEDVGDGMLGPNQGSGSNMLGVKQQSGFLKKPSVGGGLGRPARSRAASPEEGENGGEVPDFGDPEAEAAQYGKMYELEEENLRLKMKVETLEKQLKKMGASGAMMAGVYNEAKDLLTSTNEKTARALDQVKRRSALKSRKLMFMEIELRKSIDFDSFVSMHGSGGDRQQFKIIGDMKDRVLEQTRETRHALAKSQLIEEQKKEALKSIEEAAARISELEAQIAKDEEKAAESTKRLSSVENELAVAKQHLEGMDKLMSDLKKARQRMYEAENETAQCKADTEAMQKRVAAIEAELSSVRTELRKEKELNSSGIFSPAVVSKHAKTIHLALLSLWGIEIFKRNMKLKAKTAAATAEGASAEGGAASGSEPPTTDPALDPTNSAADPAAGENGNNNVGDEAGAGDGEGGGNDGQDDPPELISEAAVKAGEVSGDMAIFMLKYDSKFLENFVKYIQSEDFQKMANHNHEACSRVSKEFTTLKKEYSSLTKFIEDQDAMFKRGGHRGGGGGGASGAAGFMDVEHARMFIQQDKNWRKARAVVNFMKSATEMKLKEVQKQIKEHQVGEKKSVEFHKVLARIEQKHKEALEKWNKKKSEIIAEREKMLCMVLKVVEELVEQAPIGPLIQPSFAVPLTTAPPAPAASSRGPSSNQKKRPGRDSLAALSSQFQQKVVVDIPTSRKSQPQLSPQHAVQPQPPPPAPSSSGSTPPTGGGGAVKTPGSTPPQAHQHSVTSSMLGGVKTPGSTPPQAHQHSMTSSMLGSGGRSRQVMQGLVHPSTLLAGSSSSTSSAGAFVPQPPNLAFSHLSSSAPSAPTVPIGGDITPFSGLDSKRHSIPTDMDISEFSFPAPSKTPLVLPQLVPPSRGSAQSDSLLDLLGISTNGPRSARASPTPPGRLTPTEIYGTLQLQGTPPPGAPELENWSPPSTAATSQYSKGRAVMRFKEPPLSSISGGGSSFVIGQGRIINEPMTARGRLQSSSSTASGEKKTTPPAAPRMSTAQTNRASRVVVNKANPMWIGSPGQQ